MQIIYLDISNRGVVPTIYAKQGDVGRKFQVVLTDSGLPYIPVGGSAFSVWYSGASGEGNYTEVGDKSAFSVSGNKVTVEMISQMLSNDGEGILSLVLNDPNGNQISTWNIHYICEYVPGADSQEAKAYYTAFSHAVENLPYPDASLSVSGKAADAAATGKALEGKAPAGYGLGEASTDISGKNLLTIIAEGKTRRCEGSNVTNAPMAGSAWFYIDCDGAGYGIVHAWYHGNRYHAVATYANGVLSEWEWDNPPMVPGVEYRTTERWNGKVVYTKLMDCGAATNGGAAYAPDDATSIIRHHDWLLQTGEIWRNIPIGHINRGGAYAEVRIAPSNARKLVIYTDSLTDGLTGATWRTQLWYVK